MLSLRLEHVDVGLLRIPQLLQHGWYNNAIADASVGYMPMHVVASTTRQHYGRGRSVF